jgi:hypothetical protein
MKILFRFIKNIISYPVEGNDSCTVDKTDADDVYNNDIINTANIATSSVYQGN